ncbi:hypothetical protein ACJ41M_13405 [Staphylococcus aureus]|uniref:hypothetical protein n=3 Tax=Staphylococcus aureus TaxID=1280 RepID=UPI0032F6983F|nr:hypothetical protein [Staphylococcus aureus]
MESNFWYDHGVELVGAIITLLAFLLTFFNIRRTDKKLKEDERKRNDKQELEDKKINYKTLKMIDLITIKERDSIKRCAMALVSKKYIVAREKYDITSYTKFYMNDTIQTQNKQAFILYKRAFYSYDYKIEDELNNYLETIKECINKNHLNLNSLEKLNDKITKINEGINRSKHLTNLSEIYSTILAERMLPVYSQNETEKLYDGFEKFIKLLIEISECLID